MRKNKVSICIPSFNNAKTIAETLDSCIKQDYPWVEIIVSDNCSTDNTAEIASHYPQVSLHTCLKKGIGPNLENCIRLATGKYILFMCADDLLTSPKVVGDIAKIFKENPKVGYIGRWYYQFMNGYPGAVRVHRSNDPFFQADNPSGLAFRAEALPDCVSNKLFIEAASMVKLVLNKGYGYAIMRYDTVAVRIHPGGNTATKAFYYTDSPTLSWYNLIGPNKNFLTAYISFIQLKNWAPYKNLIMEIGLFIKLRPVNLFRPDFWLFAGIALFTPRCILRRFTSWYKQAISRQFVRIIERAE